MTVVTIQKAQTELSELIARAEAGEEIIIARENRPAVRLMPMAFAVRPLRKPGSMKGMFAAPEGVFDPLSEDELRDWEDGPISPKTGG